MEVCGESSVTNYSLAKIGSYRTLLIYLTFANHHTELLLPVITESFQGLHNRDKYSNLDIYAKYLNIGTNSQVWFAILTLETVKKTKFDEDKTAY